MFRKTKLILSIAGVGLIFPLVSLAHNPRLVPDNAGIVKIENPEISQAFYGELKGQPQIFSISSDKPFNFYINILSPDILDTRKDFPVEIYRGEELVAALDSTRYDWTKFYEPFAGDNYWKGPETEFQAETGSYTIKVYNSFSDLCAPKSGETNKANLIDPRCMAFYGRYALAIGKKESFPPNEIWNTLKVLPTLKKDFFKTSPWTTYFNYVGASLAIVILLVILIIYLAIRIFWRKKSK
jgi:hypothetical protein